VQKLLEYRDYVSERLREAAAAQRRYASGCTKPHEFAVGDKVWLSTKNLTTARPSKKLDKKFVDPFLVKERIGSEAYRLELPKTMKRLHNVFHVSLLEPYQSDGQSDSQSESDLPPDLQVKGKE
jgi:hypothetical protein